MGFGDKLKGLRDQAQQTVAENKDRIQGAVQVAGEAANTKTHGKYATRIAKVGEKVSDRVDKFAAAGSTEASAGSGTASAEDADAFAAPVADEPVAPVTPSGPDATAGGPPPEFE